LAETNADGENRRTIMTDDGKLSREFGERVREALVRDPEFRAVLDAVVQYERNRPPMKLEVRRYTIGELTGSDDWCVVDTSAEPMEYNYYGVVAFGFETESDAQAYVDFYSIPESGSMGEKGTSN
jgi:hypothetical protein